MARRRRKWIWHGIPLATWSLVAGAALWVLLPGPVRAVVTDARDDLDAPLSARALDHYGMWRDHLARSFDGYGAVEVFVPDFQVVLLSHVACGLTNVALADPDEHTRAARLLDEVAARAVHDAVTPWGKHPMQVDAWGDHNLYLSHLALVLGCRALVAGTSADTELHHRIARHLRARSTSDGDLHARSLPGSPKFPADQSVVLLALHLYDHVRGSQHSAPLARAWISAMTARFAAGDGLHVSSLDPGYPGADLPRGCALSWTCLFAAQFAPAETADLYARYAAQHFATVLGCGGMREWPADSTGPSDVDSGPVIFDLGVAATGLGIGAARLHGDCDAYAAMLRSADTIGLPGWFDTTYRLSPLLGDAILFHGLTARHWFGDPALPAARREVGAPWGPLVLTALWGLVAGWGLRRAAHHARVLADTSG